ncbi:MAG: phosphatase PAP2 family protein, partial [Ignavibacteria bacterium CHB3]|nr:phosphatase PAP2 family protein [Ignavibacteria bacterium CHB3]
RKQSKRLWRLVFIIVGGGLILLIAKYFFAPDVQSEQFDFFNATEYKLPSGHAMMGTIFYLTLAVTISRRQHSSKTKRLTIISGVVLIILIGISRILPGIHSLKDVVAGWSLGLVWLCLCWFVERYIKKASDLQKRSQQVL